MEMNQNFSKERLNPTAIYVLSIISFLCCCFAGFGIFLAGPAFFMANSKLNQAKDNPEQFDQSTVQGMNSAKIVALVALIINGLYFLYFLFSLATTDFDTVIQQYQQKLEQGGL